MERLNELARFYPTLKHLVVGLAILAAAWIAAKIFIRLLDFVFGRLAARTQSNLDDYLIAALRRPVTFLVLVAGAYVGFHAAGIQKSYVDGLLFSAGIMASVVALISLNSALLRWVRERMGDREQALFSVEFLPLIEKVGFLLVLVIGLMVILNYFRINITSILVTLGLGGLVAGLALQDTLANIFGGFTLLVDRPFRLNDRIELESGQVGDVESIGIRSTRIRTPENCILVVPNAVLVKTMVTNHSYPDARIVVRLPVSIAYGSDVEKAKGILVEAARANPLALGEPHPPRAFLVEFGDSALNLLLIFWIQDFGRKLEVQDDVIRRIHQRLQQAGIEIPFPTRTVHVKREGQP